MENHPIPSLLFCLLILASCADTSLENHLEVQLSSIVGGHPLKDKTDFQSVVALSWKDKILCSGTVVSDRFILTAAHCILSHDYPDQFPDFLDEVRVHLGGDHSHEFGPSYQVINAHIHPLYNQFNTEFKGQYDLAVIELKDSMPLPPVLLALEESQEWGLLTESTEGLIVGFGHRQNVMGGFLTPSSGEIGALYGVELPIISFSAHEVLLSKPLKSACLGDSGGPLFVQNDQGDFIQVGVASRIQGPCGSIDTRNYYARLAHSGCWIKATLKGEDIDDPLCLNEFRSREHTENVLASLQLEDVQEKLESLDLRGRLLYDLTPLTRFTNLKEIDLRDNLIHQLDGLEELDQLERVQLEKNFLDEEEFISDRGKRVFSGRYRQHSTFHKTLFYRSCTGEHSPSRDEQLIMEEILMMSATDDCRKAHERTLEATQFELEYQGVESFKMLSEYKSFTAVYLSGNKITDLDFALEWEFLTSLYLDDNLIDDVSALNSFPDLNYVSIRNNKLTDLEPLRDRQSRRRDHMIISIGGNDLVEGSCHQLFRTMCH